MCATDRSSRDYDVRKKLFIGIYKRYMAKSMVSASERDERELKTKHDYTKTPTAGPAGLVNGIGLLLNVRAPWGSGSANVSILVNWVYLLLTM